jgi:5-hydroxyisourate hydrolase-like protein (transthyretin family)
MHIRSRFHSFASPAVVLGALLLALAVASPGAQSSPPHAKPAGAIVRGTVVDAASGKPIPMVRMRLATVKPSATPDHYARTDAEGRYEFRDVAPGPVHITASKARYVALQHGQVPPATSGRPIELKAGAVLERIDFALPRASAITGRIVDDVGEPVERASVSAMRMRFVSGRRQLAQVATASTNDNGEYRIPALQPGSYYVVAAERTVGFGASMEADIGFLRTAYPAATTTDGARPVDVRAGLDTQGVDIALLPARTAKLTGLVLGRDGQPASNAWAVLQAVGAGPGTGLGGDMRTGPDGRFEFPRVLAGRYELHVRGSGAREGAILPLVVSDDLELVVPMVSGRMTGKIFPPEGATAPPTSVTIHVEPVSDTNTFGTGFGGTPEEDWTFDFDFLLGPRVVRASRLPNGWHLRGVYLDGNEVTDEVFTFTGNELVEDVEIVLTTEAAEVNGTIAGPDGQPCGSCTAIVFAEDPLRWRPPSRFIHAGRPDQQQVFRLRGLPPEQYLVAAVEEVEDGEWLDPEFLDRLRGHAERLDLRAAGNATVTLKAVRP